jgi:hypothetical protein
MTDAWKLIDQKLTVPSDMRTAEWSMLPQWLRERSFYMAGVSRAEILDEFRREASLIVAGESSIPQSEKNLEQFLDRIGYQPEPGDEGTIRDLRSWRRMRIALRTNIDLLQGWQQKERGHRPGPAAAFPAWELIRIEPRTNEREWLQRWEDAGGQPGRMIALKTDPIWSRLGSRELFPDALGVDYPPFAWGSGMGWKAIGFRDAEQLGLIDADWAPPTTPPVSSPNESLQSSPAITAPEIRDELATRMGALAEWEGDVLRFTDPNGTAPTTAEKLAATWERGLPEQFADLPDGGLPQRGSFLRWANGEDQDRADIDDLARLASRLIPSFVPALLYRRVAASAAEANNLSVANALRTGTTLTQWSATMPAAIGGAEWQILYTITRPRTAADIGALLTTYAPDKLAAGQHVYAGRQTFRIVGREVDEANRTIKLEMEEMP